MITRSTFVAALAGTASLLSTQVSALYFYMEPNVQKCFYEELPKDTLVVGHWSADVYHRDTQSFTPAPPTAAVLVTIDETFDNNHRVVENRMPAPSGKFTFTAHDAGEHAICFTSSGIPHSGFFGSGAGPDGKGAVRFTLDLAIGATSDIESNDKAKISDIVQKVKDLNGRLQDIRREQVFQREREAEFRDQSESVNSRVVKWTMIQLVVLGVTCAWQLSHLRAFFIKQKLT